MRKTVLLLALGAASVLAQSKGEKGFKQLFNGKDLTGWQKAKENEGTFNVVNGEIVAKGPRSHLFYTGPLLKQGWKNFELKVDVLTKPSANGGIYFHTAYQEQGWPDKGFEVQVNNSYVKDPRKTGSLYMVQDNNADVAQDDKWFTEHIVVKDGNVKVFVDGKQIVDWTQPAGYTGPNKNMAGRVLASGTVALQGHDPGSETHYKNIRIKALK